MYKYYKICIYIYNFLIKFLIKFLLMDNEHFSSRNLRRSKSMEQAPVRSGDWNVRIHLMELSRQIGSEAGESGALEYRGISRNDDT